MPIYDYLEPLSISHLYTYEETVGEVMTLTKITDNERVQLSNIRNHINIAITQVIELVGVSSIPKYGMYLKASIEPTLHHSGLHWINLELPVEKFITDNNGNINLQGLWFPARGIKKIQRISVRKSRDYSQAPVETIQPDNIPINKRLATIWNGILPLGADLVNIGSGSVKSGNFTKFDLSQLQQLSSVSENNVQFSDSIGWSWEGNNIYLFFGNNIATPFQGNFTGDEQSPYILPFVDISIYCYRQPLLDDLQSPSTSQTYRQKMDIPDEYTGLVVAYAQKRVLEQLNADANSQMEVNQKIQLELQKLQSNVTEDIQFEKIQREKTSYGERV